MDKGARDNVSATKFAFSAMCRTSVVNSEIAESWRCCRADQASEAYEWLMICKNYKVTPFEEVAEMTDGQMHRQQFAIKSTVFGFRFAQFSTKKCKRL